MDRPFISKHLQIKDEAFVHNNFNAGVENKVQAGTNIEVPGSCQNPEVLRKTQ